MSATSNLPWRRGRIWRLLLLASVGAIAFVVLVSVGRSPAVPSAPEPLSSVGSAKPITELSSAHLAVLDAFHQPATLAVPAEVRASARSAGLPTLYAPNVALARAVPNLISASSAPWLVVPGDRSACLFAEEVFICRTLGQVAQGDLYFSEYEPVGASPLPPAGTPASMTVVGLAPNGVTAISGTTRAGRRVDGILGRNAYAVHGVDLMSLSMERPGMAPITVRLNDR